jgi:hypothetical protein
MHDLIGKTADLRAKAGDFAVAVTARAFFSCPATSLAR